MTGNVLKEKHNAAVTCLVRWRLNALFARLRDGGLYQGAPGEVLQAACEKHKGTPEP